MIKKFKCLAILLVGFMFFAVGQPVFAEQDGPKNVGVITPQSYQHLYDASCYYTLNGTSIGVSGTTATYYTVSKITTTVYLEKWTSAGWSVVKSWTGTEYNNDYCNVTGSYTGIRGTTYRVRCFHRVDMGNLIETNTSYTGSFTVN
ncbi:DUF6147 family protein [Desulfotomaculum nigrificans]|uniref:DUF6147 family protein n=1 Tax=Desulfotomaculum nigrificans TaxID=1565 RepID=UPI0001FADF30|nr:DUF6147 family protein [Desulfotomaculum nigrificans]